MTVAKHQLGYGNYLRFKQLVLKHSGLYFPEKKQADLENGIAKALRDAPDGVTDVESYYAFLDRPGVHDARSELDRLINILTIGETHFFRDSAQFNALATRVLPAIIARKRSAAASVGLNPPAIPQLRIWSAGCATGEEPYSIAMLLRELIPDIQKWHILILGTDINDNSLTLARKASYTDWSFRVDQAKSMRRIYFKQQGKRYQLRDDIRRQVTFAYHNLIEDDFPSAHNNIVAMDLILCRNVTIYFTPETTQRLIKKFYATLIDGGWLVVGHSEPSLTTYRDFHAYSYPKAILYQKTSQPTPWPDDWDNLQAGNRGTSANKQTASPTNPKLNGQFAARHQPAKGATTSDLGKPKPSTKPITFPPRLKDTALLPPLDDPKEAIPKRYQEAQSLITQGNVKQAIQILEGIAAQNKTYTPAFCLLARAYADLGLWQKARFWSQKAIKQDSLQPTAYYVLALVEENEGYLRKAINNFRKVIYLDPKGPLPYFHLALLYKKERQPAHAKRALNNVIRILRSWPPDKIIPESGDKAGRLLQAAEQISREL